MCLALVGKVEIVGWMEPGLDQGTNHVMMSMEEFMNAQENHQSTRNKMPVAPFFFPKSKPSVDERTDDLDDSIVEINDASDVSIYSRDVSGVNEQEGRSKTEGLGRCGGRMQWCGICISKRSRNHRKMILFGHVIIYNISYL